MNTDKPCRIRVRTEHGGFAWRVTAHPVEGGFAVAADGKSIPTAADAVFATPEAASIAIIEALGFGGLVTERLDG